MMAAQRTSGGGIVATLARPALSTLSLVVLVAAAILLNYVERFVVPWKHG